MKPYTTGLLLLVVLAMTANAHARPQFWLSAGIDHSKADAVEFTGLTSSSLADQFSGTAPRFGLGMVVTDWIGVEAGWSRFGSDSGVVSFPSGCLPIDEECPDSISDAEQSGSAYWIAAVPTLRRGDFAFFGKIGASRTIRETALHRFTPVKDSDHGVLLGAGVAYYFTRRFGVRVDLEYMGGTARTAGLGVEYRF